MEHCLQLCSEPLGSHHTMKEYTQFLLRRYALPQFVKGVKEVHIVFDNPGRQIGDFLVVRHDLMVVAGICTVVKTVCVRTA